MNYPPIGDSYPYDQIETKSQVHSKTRRSRTKEKIADKNMLAEPEDQNLADGL